MVQNLTESDLNILLGAYACLPNAGTEPGNGWNWATHLAQRGMAVTVLTRSDDREQVEAYQRDHPLPNLKFVFVEVATTLLKIPGMAHYILWNRAAVKVAKALHRARPFDIAHHVTYSSVHVPTQLWRIGVPTVFGPVGGGQITPAALLGYLGESARFERLRTFVTKALPYSPFHRFALRKMDVVLASNAATVGLVRAMGRPDVEPMFDVGVAESFMAPAPPPLRARSATLRLLWVARIVPRKGLCIALDALSQTTCGANLTVIGDTHDQNTIRKKIADLGLTDRVYWTGERLPWLELKEMYPKHDAILFTSLREAAGAQLMEAMALGLPVITLDLHGAREIVPPDAGIKVPARPGQVAQDFGAAIDRFARLTDEERAAMSLAGWTFASRNTWTVRARQAAQLYERLAGNTLAYPPPATDEVSPVTDSDKVASLAALSTTLKSARRNNDF